MIICLIALTGLETVTGLELKHMNKLQKSKTSILIINKGFSRSSKEIEIQPGETNFQIAKRFFMQFLTIKKPINICEAKNCQHCCLSVNTCGTKIQCENSLNTNQFFGIVYGMFAITIILFVIYKIYNTDSLPEHNDTDKIDDKTLALLINLYIHNRENRRKFKL